MTLRDTTLVKISMNGRTDRREISLSCFVTQIFAKDSSPPICGRMPINNNAKKGLLACG